jgi:hypothetical protein
MAGVNTRRQVRFRIVQVNFIDRISQLLHLATLRRVPMNPGRHYRPRLHSRSRMIIPSMIPSNGNSWLGKTDRRCADLDCEPEFPKE